MLICVVRDDLRHDVEDTIQECNGDRIEVGKECDQGDGTRIAGPEPVVTKLRKLRWCGPGAMQVSEGLSARLFTRALPAHYLANRDFSCCG